VYSWVRYHRSYVPEFDFLIPYVVLCVQMKDGPRMFGRLVPNNVEPWIGMQVRAIIERCESGARVVAFVAEY
jgi:uncharacterized OB-fold protein